MSWAEVIPYSIAASIGFLFGAYSELGTWHREIIRRGFAQHNPTTGAWEWKS